MSWLVSAAFVFITSTQNTRDFELKNDSHASRLKTERNPGQRSPNMARVMNVDLKACKPTIVPSDLFIPIFVLTRDRVSSLRMSLQSYWDTISSSYEIIILDHNSTFPPMVEYLRQLKGSHNISVVPLSSNTWQDAITDASQFIKHYLNRRPHVSFYVFTDPDIAFLRTAPDVLLFYAGLLTSCSEHNVVGPALQISDVPTTFKKHKSVYDWEKQYWKQVPAMATWNGIGYHVVGEPIDTTFAMYRSDTPLARLTRPSLRAYAPYAAVHVDWYHDTEHLPEDKLYYVKHQSGVNNW